ncbi:unnamed protein product, partial [Polarella glacialis]
MCSNIKSRTHVERGCTSEIRSARWLYLNCSASLASSGNFQCAIWFSINCTAKAKSCDDVCRGAPNSPCTGIWTSFSPLIRPTEVEFEFTMNGRVDLPNACVVFTEKPFEGALPDCKVGVQFTVRGGMQLCGGGGNLVRISNDGKIQNDKWNK